MQSFLVALVTAAIATQTGALPAPAMAAAVLVEGLVSVDVVAVVPTLTLAVDLPTPKVVHV